MTAIDLSSLSALSAASSVAASADCAISTVPAAVPAGFVLLEMRRRSTKETPVARENAYRCALVPDSMLAFDTSATPSRFVALLQSTLLDLACARFAEFCKASPSALTVDARLFRVDALLAYWAEVKQSQRITGEAISEWLKSSATLATLPPAAQAVWTRELPKMAAPSYAGVFTKKQAASIVARFADADLDHPICCFVAGRCNAILSREETSALDF